MEKIEFLEITRLTRELYSRPEFLREQSAFDAWYEAMNDIPFDQCKEALMRHVKSSRYLPTIADLRDPGRRMYEFTAKAD